MGDLVHLTLGPRRGMRKATSALAWYDRGCALEAIDPGAAIVAYRRAVAGRPALADAHNNLGRLLHDRGEPAEAERCYRCAVAAEPTIGLYWFNLGVALEDRGEHDAAIETYERALAIDPMLADAHYNLARQLEQRGRNAGDELVMFRVVRHLKSYRDLVRQRA